MVPLVGTPGTYDVPATAAEVAVPELEETSCCIPTAGFPLVEYEKTVRVFLRNASPSCASQASCRRQGDCVQTNGRHRRTYNRNVRAVWVLGVGREDIHYELRP
jgi:hypothetical protein